jgi:pimeloyl-ACP methyl ester carboxylesterase
VKQHEAYAVARDGAPIYYRVVGQAGSTDLVLCDGIGCDGYVWKYLERGLADDHRLIHLHYRGHGRTPVPRDRQRVSIADLADDVASVMEAAGSKRAVLVGHSMGVQVCLEAFRRHHDLVSGLVLICGAYGHPLRTFRGRKTLETALPWIAYGANRVPRLVRSIWKNLIPTRLAYTIATRVEVNGELIQVADFMPYLEHIAQVDPALFLDMMGHMGRHSAKEVLSTIDVPSLVIAGGRDNMTPRWLSEEMAKEIPGSELLVVEDGSHTTPIERPQLVTDTVARFLRERVRRSAGASLSALS